jgi:hypothetical protein
LVVLGVGVVVASRSLLGLFAGPELDGAGPAVEADPLGEDPMASDTEPKVVWSDLLAVHGSFAPGTVLRVAFADAAETRPAAPAGETQQGVWQGEDPPCLQLGVVMISQKSRRAVLGGAIVGIGDRVAGARVVAIEAGVVTAEWQGQKLSYDLDADAPREFRSELVRRAASKHEAEVDAGAGARVVEAKKEKGK